MSFEVVVTKRDGFEYGKQVSDGRTPDVLRFGQVVTLKGLVNDGKLIEIGFFARHDKEIHSRVQCSGCGRVFASEQYMLQHLPEHQHGTGRDNDDLPSSIKVMTESELEQQALQRRGITYKDIGTQKASQAPLPDNRKPCPICHKMIAPQGMRLHVVSCSANQPAKAAAKKSTAKAATKTATTVAKKTATKRTTKTA